MTKHQVQTGGKLFIAGEYAILTPGQLALIAPIPIFMTAEIEPASDFLLYSDMFDKSVGLDPDQDYALIQETIALAHSYLASRGINSRPFSLRITGKMERQGKKLGIGSSGSVTVLVLRALAAFYEQDWSDDLVFKLAAYTLLKRGDNGSMGDIACISFDELVLYQSFDRAKVASWINEDALEDVLSKDWGYEIRAIQPALPLELVVGWTGKPAISKDMINQVKAAISVSFLSETKASVIQLVAALEGGDQEQLDLAVKKVAQLLEDLHPAIYTDDLRRLVESAHGLNAVAKSSGSGGGDCGIALVFDQVAHDKLIERWLEVGIEPISSQKLG